MKLPSLQDWNIFWKKKITLILQIYRKYKVVYFRKPTRSEKMDPCSMMISTLSKFSRACRSSGLSQQDQFLFLIVNDKDVTLLHCGKMWVTIWLMVRLVSATSIFTKFLHLPRNSCRMAELIQLRPLTLTLFTSRGLTWLVRKL